MSGLTAYDSSFGSAIKELSYAYGSGGDTSRYRYGFNKQEKDGELGDYYVFEYRVQDPRLGRFLSLDPIGNRNAFVSPYSFARNNPLFAKDLMGLDAELTLNVSEQQKNQWTTNSQENSSIDNSASSARIGTTTGECSEDNSLSNTVIESIDEMCSSMPKFVADGTLAHAVFTGYWRRYDPNEIYWTADKAVSTAPLASILDRPDLVYDNGSIAGVWELKPAPPRATAILAAPQAQGYARQLNETYNTYRFQAGSSGGAPMPFVGPLTLIDPITKRKFVYTITNPNDGSIYWTEILTPESEPVPDPVAVPVESPVPDQSPQDRNVPINNPPPAFDWLPPPIWIPIIFPYLNPSTILRPSPVMPIIIFPIILPDDKYGNDNMV